MSNSTHLEPELPKRSWKSASFLIAAALVPLSFLAVVAFGLHDAAQRGPVQTTSASASHIFFWAKKKDALAAGASGSRVILLGGSGVLYSVRAQELANALQVPVINMGLHADLGLDYLFYRARNALRPGDIAVPFLEYSLYVQERPGWTLADYVIPFDFRYLTHASVREALALAGDLTPAEYLEKISGGWFGVAESGAQITGAINAAGDLVANVRANQMAYQRKALDEAGPFGGTKLNVTQSRKIVEFLQWCRRNGVHVVAGFPAYLDFPGYHVPPEENFYFEAADLYRSQGIPLLGVPQEFLFPKAMFFDTNYHMNDYGANAMTAMVTRRLATIARCEISRDWIGTRRPECASLHQYLVIDLTQDGAPNGTLALSGFSSREAWGRWTDGPAASVRVGRTLDVPFRLDFVIPHVYAEKSPYLVTVRAGSETRSFVAKSGRTSLEFDGSAGNDRIDISIPEQSSPQKAGISGDARRIGLGIARLEMYPRMKPF